MMLKAHIVERHDFLLHPVYGTDFAFTCNSFQVHLHLLAECTSAFKDALV